MIVCHAHKFIYIKTRKTASTSIEIALSKFCGPDDVITPFSAADEQVRAQLGYRGPQNFKIQTSTGGGIELKNHVSSAYARDLFGKDVWKSYYKFTFERNPFDRAVSRYYWMTRKHAEKPDIHRFIAAAPKHLISCWDLYTIQDKIAVDHVGKYENMSAELELLSDRIGLPERIVLPEYRAKSSFRQDRRHYREILSTEDRALIENVCAKELKAFEYKW